MNIKWYGHASFGLRANDGSLIVTDPYDPATSGYKPFPDPADIIIMSSDNDSFHCNAGLVPQKKDAVIINALELAQQGGKKEVKGMTFQAIKAMEALNHRFHDPDQNGMYRFELDGIKIGHLGDAGNAFSKAQLEFFQNLDILLALAGGHPTIELNDLKTVIDATKPKLIIPMHFRTLRYKPRNTFWISSFLEYFDDDIIDFACDSEVSLTKAGIPTETRVLVMDYL